VQTLDEQVAVVTGGAAGIGRGIGEVLASEGARVVIADINARAGEAAAAALRAEGGEAVAAVADVRERSQLAAMTAMVVERFGRIDILAANAGIYPLTALERIDDEAWNRVMDLNAKGALHAVQACLPPMLSRGYGRIVLTSSITGPITGHPGFAAYGASKAAMLGMMRSAAIELATFGVTINAVMPGNVRTPGTETTGDEHNRQMLAAIPMREFAEPTDIGWAVRFLASPEARYITGQTLIVDGGQVLPEAPDALKAMDVARTDVR
jgi:3-oxoacyl-[acyl-carrier protein] reductase